MAKTLLSTLVFALAASAQRQRAQTRWGQCGGSGYDGPTACPTQYYCTVGNAWYSQCVPEPGSPDDPLPGVPDSPIATTSFETVITVTAPTPDAPPTVVTTYITFLTPSPSATASFTAPPESTQNLVPDEPITFTPLPGQQPRRWVTAAAKREPAPSPAPEPAPAPAPAPKPEPEPEVAGDPTPSELKSDQLWIRAVAPPHFHEYLQTKPQNEPSVAIMGSHTTAGQYNIVDGQLISGGSDDVLYMHVEKPDDMTQRKLATWFNYTKNDFGNFVFSGDAVTWSTPEIQRQNLAAWLVCENNELFINTGAYAYQTPAGCADQTIHFYNGATANE